MQNKMKKGIYLIIGWFMLIPAFVYGSDTLQIKMQARIQKDAILLRWAAPTPLLWKQTNRSGFRLERYTVVRNHELLADPEKRILGDTVMTARPLNEWEALVTEDNQAAVIAQALYGDDFELSEADAQGVARIINMSQELEQRFTFSLYAADQSFGAACMAGWGWRDADVKPGERYLYRIIPLLPEKNDPVVEIGFAYVSIDEYEELPAPVGLAGVWGDKSVMLVWDYGLLSHVYNSYFIERAEEGLDFVRQSGQPVSNLNNRDEQASQRLYFQDTLGENGKEYRYRVRGVTAFGEVGPPSDTITGRGKVLLAYVPHINRAIINDEGVLELEWEFDERGNTMIRGFELNRADRVAGDYRVVAGDLPAVSRSLKYGALQSSNYFTITAIALEGESRVSFPVLVQPEDTMPPAIPESLTGEVDTLGVVTLQWRGNREPDLLGYKVYRGQVKGEEWVPLFDAAWRDTVYRDTIEVHNLNANVYYVITAVDMRYNQSVFSKILELKKPDMTPPLSPVISGYGITAGGIEIRWTCSPDADVAEHRLYRIEKGRDGIPEVLKRFPGGKVSGYTDPDIVSGVRYTYSVTAVDSSGLESVPTPSLTAFSNRVAPKNNRIDRLDAVVDKEHGMIKLVWSDRLQEVAHYELYKGEGDLPLSTWKTVPGWQYEILDEGLIVNVKYHYLIRAVFQQGGNSESKSITINL